MPFRHEIQQCHRLSIASRQTLGKRRLELVKITTNIKPLKALLAH
jgi:hypothetical protein